MPRIVVTGAAGGTGASIVTGLHDCGCDVVPTDLRPWTPESPPGYVQLDLRDAAGVNDLLAGADGLVHFGSPPADSMYSTTEAFHHVAVAGFNLFQAAANTGVTRVAWASSIEVYGNLTRHPSLPVTEQSPLSPPGIYGSSKLLLERLAIDFSTWHNIAFAGFRLARIIYDNPNGRTKLHRLAADPAMGADCLWAYVDARDVATACLAWLESERPGAEVFNLAAANIHLEADTPVLLQEHGYGHLAAPQLETADSTPFSTSRVREMLGWNERYDWRESLQTFDPNDPSPPKPDTPYS